MRERHTYRVTEKERQGGGKRGCVCMCIYDVCGERERHTHRVTEKERQGGGKRGCVCLCMYDMKERVCVFVYV